MQIATMEILKNKGWLQGLMLTLAVTLTYGHTLSVPFYLDDILSISGNPGIYSQNFDLLWQTYARRIGTYTTFFLNFKFHQLNVAGYHLVNIAIHIGTVLTAWAFTQQLINRTMAMGKQNSCAMHWLPLAVALIFALHPLQTQAVTYVVQRAAELAALFYLLSLLAYCWLRMAESLSARLGWLALTLTSSVLALSAKESAATLPLALLLLEWMFFAATWRQRLVAASATVAGLFAIWLLFSLATGGNPLTLAALQALSAETPDITREAYFASQMKVLWGYIGHFFWPAGLHMEYDTPLEAGLQSMSVLMALLGHLVIIAAALWGARRWPIVAFGVLFYYLAHAVESSIIPIRDLAFEHRNYLPNLGIGLAVAAVSLEIAAKKGVQEKNILIAMLALVLLLGTLTWQRNALWRDPEAFYQSNVASAPNAHRAWGWLSSIYVTNKKYSEAIDLANKIYDRLPVEMRQAVIGNKIISLAGVGKMQEAMLLADKALDSGAITDLMVRAKILNTRAVIYAGQGNLLQAEANLVEAVKSDPSNTNAMKNLAKVDLINGNLERGEKLCLAILRIDPQHEEASQILMKIRRTGSR